jgi:uncharacterized membrane protein YqjE
MTERLLTNSPPRRNVAAVLHDILGNVDHLVRAEIQLAKAEVREELGAAGASAKLLVAGVALAYLAIAFLLVCLFFLLETVAAPWAAAFAVALGTGVVAAMLIYSGLKKIQRARPAHTLTLATRTEHVA